MGIETGRTPEDQTKFEIEVVRDLEKSYYATNNWRDKEAPGIYATRFIDAMIRIQCGDIETVKMKHETDPVGHEIIRLTLPRWSYRPDWEMTLERRVDVLERYEPNIRGLLPLEES